MYSPELVFKKTPDGEHHIKVENFIIEGDLPIKTYWQELSTEAPEADDQVFFGFVTKSFLNYNE